MEDAQVRADLDSGPIPEDFDPRGVLGGAWGIVGGDSPQCSLPLRFQTSLRPWVEGRRWPGLISNEADETGQLTLRLRAPPHNEGLPVEVLAWIRGWGASVEVLEPGWLRGEWLREARELVSRFEVVDQ